jgi:hypothetical protein
VQRPVWSGNEPNKTGARSARALTRGQNPLVLTIYLARVLCLSVCDCVCVSQFVSERSAILLVLIIKLTKASRRRVWRGRDRDGEIWKGTDQRGRV